MTRIETLKARCAAELSPHGADLVVKLCALAESEIARKDAALRELLAEAIEHRRNIVEAKAENFRDMANPVYAAAYDKEVARFDALIDRGRSALTPATET